MKIKKIILIGILVISIGCEKEDLPKGTPKCIEDKISEIAQGQVWNPPAKIYRYEYNDQFVYYFPARCCDISSKLYDEDCNIICSPDGGWTGSGDGHCTDFFSSRKNGVLIWADDRE